MLGLQNINTNNKQLNAKLKLGRLREELLICKLKLGRLREKLRMTSIMPVQGGRRQVSSHSDLSIFRVGQTRAVGFTLSAHTSQSELSLRPPDIAAYFDA